MNRSLLSAVFALVIANCPLARADVKLPSVLGNHMVLQRHPGIDLGLGKTSGELTVQLENENATAKTDEKVPERLAGAAEGRREVAHSYLQRYQQDYAERHFDRRGLGWLRPVEQGMAAHRDAEGQESYCGRELHPDQAVPIPEGGKRAPEKDVKVSWKVGRCEFQL